ISSRDISGLHDDETSIANVGWLTMSRTRPTISRTKTGNFCAPGATGLASASVASMTQSVWRAVSNGHNVGTANGNQCLTGPAITSCTGRRPCADALHTAARIRPRSALAKPVAPTKDRSDQWHPAPRHPALAGAWAFGPARPPALVPTVYF